MGIVGCYNMHLYCDNRACKIEKSNTAKYSEIHRNENLDYITLHKFTGRDRSECIEKARSVGWVFHNQRAKPVQLISCPYCSGKKTVRIKKYKEIL